MVSFANPKRIRPGEPPEPAIAPRKLFVGQVSSLLTNSGTSSGSADVWAPVPISCYSGMPCCSGTLGSAHAITGNHAQSISDGVQVPKDATERDLRPLFEPFGEIISLNVLRTQRGQGPSAGAACAYSAVLPSQQVPLFLEHTVQHSSLLADVHQDTTAPTPPPFTREIPQ